MLNTATISMMLEKMLNDNNLDMLFKVDYWVDHIDRRFEEDENGVVRPFIPVMLNNTPSEFRPIPDVLINDQEVTANVFFPIEFKNQVLVVLRDLAKKIVGKKVKLEDNQAIMNMTIPSVNQVEDGTMEELNRQDNRIYFQETSIYGIAQFDLYLTGCGEDFMFGNSAKVYLSDNGTVYEQLVRIPLTVGNNKELDGEQMINGKTGLSIAQMNSTTFNISFYYKSSSTMQQGILEDTITGDNQNKIYYLKFVIGSLNVIKQVLIQNSTINMVLGDLISISCDFKPALEL